MKKEAWIKRVKRKNKAINKEKKDEELIKKTKRKKKKKKKMYKMRVKRKINNIKEVVEKMWRYRTGWSWIKKNDYVKEEEVRR